MTTTIISSNVSVLSGNAVQLAGGETCYVESGVSVTDSDDTGMGTAIASPGSSAIEVDGHVFSPYYGIYEGKPVYYAEAATIFISSSGLVSGNTAAITNYGYTFITNYGEIISHTTVSGTGIACDPYGTINNAGVIDAGIGIDIMNQFVDVQLITTNNTGIITGIQYSYYSEVNNTYQKEALSNSGRMTGAIAMGTANADSLVNTGVIDGSVALGGGTGDSVVNRGLLLGSLTLGDGNSDSVANKGTISGAITLGNGSGVRVDSSGGIVDGMIMAGTGGDMIIAGQDGGQVFGNTGNDTLIANPSQAAADAHAKFVLDGNGVAADEVGLGGGINALYGGGAFNTFLTGDLAGGRNQIHGGLSQMSGIGGYSNNTVSFAGTPAAKSVYVDLLAGHNAYLYANANHTGALTFEDSIQNVPNVIGSAGADVIRADNGTDVIQGGAGGDSLYAGTGVDTFVYSGYADSNTPSGYDTIAGFATGQDKIDLSALNSDPSHLLIAGGSNSTTFYLEANAGHFNPATDLAISFLGANAVKASDVIF